MTDLHFAEAGFISKHFSNDLSPFHMCPVPLVIEIINISHIRCLVSQAHASGTQRYTQEANDILQRIIKLRLDGWANTKPYLNEDWMKVGKIYQAATTLYCIIALQSISVLPQSSQLRTLCEQSGHVLRELLGSALSSPRVKIFLLWPLVVLGVEAVHGGPTMREFVYKHLPEQSRYGGTYVPLAAQSTLQRFWSSGSTSWDCCFDRPFSFTIQITVDTAGLLAS